MCDLEDRIKELEKKVTELETKPWCVPNPYPVYPHWYHYYRPNPLPYTTCGDSTSNATGINEACEENLC